MSNRSEDLRQAGSHIGLQSGINGVRGYDSAAQFQHAEIGAAGSGQELRQPSIIADIYPYTREVILAHPEDVGMILEWMREYADHLYPPPQLPDFSDWNDVRNKHYAVRDWLQGVVTSQGKQIRPGIDSTAFRAEDADGKLVAVSNIVWRGMDFIPEGKGYAYRERNLVHPDYQGKRLGIGKTIAAYALEYAFHIATPYKGHGASEVRGAEILTPENDPNTVIKHGYFERIGYLTHGEPRPLVPEDPNSRQFQPYRITKGRYDNDVRSSLLPLIAKFLDKGNASRDNLAKA